MVGGAGQASLGPSLKGTAKECVQTRNGCEKRRKRMWRKGREGPSPGKAGLVVITALVTRERVGLPGTGGGSPGEGHPGKEEEAQF